MVLGSLSDHQDRVPHIKEKQRAEVGLIVHEGRNPLDRY